MKEQSKLDREQCDLLEQEKAARELQRATEKIILLKEIETLKNDQDLLQKKFRREI